MTGPVDPTPDPTPPGPTPEETALKEAQDAAMAAYTAAMAAVGGAKDYVAMQNAQKYADMAKEANDGAQAATASAMAEEYQMKAETARDQAQEAAMMRGLGITKLANETINQSDINNANLTDTKPPDPVSNAVRVGTALEDSATGLVTPVGAADDTAAANTATVGGTHQGRSTIVSNNAASATAEYPASGLRLTVKLPTGSDTNFPTPDTVTRGETPRSLMMRGGWMGAELVGGSATGTSRTYANVYTDIKAEKTVPEYENRTSGEGVINPAVDLSESTTVAVTGDVPGDGSNFTGTYNANTTDNVPALQGRFTCPTSANGQCAISLNDRGGIVSVEGYQFQPEKDETTTMADSDYLAWGVWLTVPNAVPVDGTPNAASAGAFASGNNVFVVYPQLKGKATYNGVANGLYSAGGYVEQFDADVMLEADFGAIVGADSTPATGNADENDGLRLGAVTGTVSNINAGGMAVDGSLMLGRAFVDADTGTALTTNGFKGDTSGTLVGRAMSGKWGGQFYGPNEAIGTGIQTEYPTTAAGTFGASSGGTGADQIRILGAFGTWKAE